MVQLVVANETPEAVGMVAMDGPTGTAKVGTAAGYSTSAGVSAPPVTVDPSAPSSAGYREAVAVSVGAAFHQVNPRLSPMLIGGQRARTTTTGIRTDTTL